MLHDHPLYPELLTLLRSAKKELTRDWHGFVYRCVAPKWARPEFLISGKGTLQCGSRWMRPGVTPAVYAASTENIALKESRRPYTHFGIKKPLSQPRVIVEMEAKLECVADLTSIDQIIPWPSIDELLDEDWEGINTRAAETLSQAFGRALFQLKFAGLVVPSARDRRGRNLIWFPSKLGKNDGIQITGEDELNEWIAQ